MVCVGVAGVRWRLDDILFDGGEASILALFN
jgi:hypothetical protein